MNESHYARRNAIPLTVVALCAIAGAVFSPGLFPDLPIWRPIFGDSWRYDCLNYRGKLGPS